MREALLTTNLGLPNRRSGKVRDLYDVDLGDEQGLLIVATDRISAFDVVLGNGLPGKGIVLTQISRFWFDYFGDSVDHHLLSTDIADVPGLSDAERKELTGRIMLCRKTDRVHRARLHRRQRLEGLSTRRRGLRHHSPGRATQRRPSRAAAVHAVYQS